MGRRLFWGPRERSQRAGRPGMRNWKDGHEIDGRRNEVSVWNVNLPVQMISPPEIATSLKMKFERLEAQINLKDPEN